jgi:hypothetical protein
LYFGLRNNWEGKERSKERNRGSRREERREERNEGRERKREISLHECSCLFFNYRNSMKNLKKYHHVKCS